MKNFLRRIKKKIKDLQSEKNELQHKVTSLLEENKALKQLAQMPSEDHMTQEIAKRELAMETKKKRRYVQQKQLQVRNTSKKRYFQESEESESSDEKIRYFNAKRASSSSESSSEEESE